ncbi:MAG: hypothetical protein K2P78_03080 [Gemmataceae bacterium]|nr:hypothetical protein [Gemmataceae bacterium]
MLRLRLDALGQIEGEYRDMVKRGMIPELTYHKAALRRLRAELELTDDKPKRIGIREQIVDRVRRLEELSEATGLDRKARARHLELRVERLNAEIELERERHQSPRARVSECRCR